MSNLQYFIWVASSFISLYVLMFIIIPSVKRGLRRERHGLLAEELMHQLECSKMRIRPKKKS